MACQNKIPTLGEETHTLPVQKHSLPDKEKLWQLLLNSSMAADLLKTDHGSPTHINPYHEEGNVLNHTRMVFEEMQKYCSANNIQGEAESACLLLALCHDLGKFEARAIKVNEKGEERVVFYNHPSYSVHRFVEFCQETNLTTDLISSGWYYDLIQAIYLHDQALDVFGYPGEKFSKSIWDKWQRLLTYNSKLNILLPAICNSDNNGRITQMPRKAAGTINIFEQLDDLLLNDLPVPPQERFFSHPCNTIADLAKGLIEKAPIVALAVGVQGSGKSTIFQGLKQHLGDDFEVVSYDQFVQQLATKNGKTYRQLFTETISGQKDWLGLASHLHDEYLLKRFKSSTPPKILILDRTHVSAKTRNHSLAKVDEILNDLKKQNQQPLDYKTACLTVLTPITECIRRDSERGEQKVGDKVIHDKAKSFMPPLYGERPIWGSASAYSYDFLLYATNLSDQQLVFSEQPLE